MFLKRMQKQFSDFFCKQNFHLNLFRQKMLMKNLVLLQFHSNSDLHTFQKMLRKRNRDLNENFVERQNKKKWDFFCVRLN